MRKQLGFVTGLFLMLLSGTALSALDPLWMFADQDGMVYGQFRFCDTTRFEDLNCVEQKEGGLPDTGDAYNGTYINFNYQFSSDTFKVYDRFDVNTVRYQDYRPGYAGFKTAWDLGMTGFALPRYDYLVFAHKGPLAAHKVTVNAWYNDGECGSPSYKETLGTFMASPEWKLDTIVIPESVKNKPDVARNSYPYFELAFLITNINSADTTSGPPGNLKIDEIRLVGCNPVDSSPIPQTVAAKAPVTFRVVAKSPSQSTDVLTFQWMKDGVAIPNATSSTYTIPATLSSNAGSYLAAVTVPSSGKTYNSQPAQLTVTPEEGSKGCGCGAGTGLAFIPPIFFKVMSRRRKKKQ